MTDEKLSRSNNLYFDVTVQDSPCQAKKVRVMADEEHSHSFFSKCMDERSPVKFTALSPSKSGQTFFNKKVGSRAAVSKRPLRFSLEETQDNNVESIKSSEPAGLIAVSGYVNWLELEREVAVGDQLRRVRDGEFQDDTGKIQIAVWGQLIDQLQERKSLRFTDIVTSTWRNQLKLMTTTSTKIQNIDSLDCPKSGMSAVKENGYNLICCPEIVSANHQEYYSCRNITCRKKILVKDMTTKIVTCEHCKRKMLLKSLNHTFIVDLILETKGKQVSLTMFPNVIETLKLDITIIEEEILLLENYDFTYNHKKVVTKVEKHEDLI